MKARMGIWAAPLAVLVSCGGEGERVDEQAGEPIGSSVEPLLSACMSHTPDQVITANSTGWQVASGDATNHGGSCGWAWIVENQNVLEKTINLGSGIGGTDWPYNQADCNSTYIDTWWWKKFDGQTTWAEVGICRRQGAWVNGQCTFPSYYGSCAISFDPADGVTAVKTATTAWRGSTLLENWAGVYVH